MPKSDVDDLAERIKALSPAAQLRLSAELLERGHAEKAYAIARFAVTEIGAALALRDLRRTERTAKGG